MNQKDRSFYQTVEARHTVRNFAVQPVEEEKIKRILTCGLKAPSHNHLREWHFILLKNPELRRELLLNGKAFTLSPPANGSEPSGDAHKQPDYMSMEPIKAVYAYSVPIQQRVLLTAPEVLVVCFKMGAPLHQKKSLYSLNNFASAWMVTENLLLAMAAEDLYGVTMVPSRTDLLKKMLHIPDEMEIATLLPFGYAAEEPELPQVSVQPEDCLHIDRW